MCAARATSVRRASGRRFREGLSEVPSVGLVVHAGLDAGITLSLIVHEATHTIQDWRDLVSTDKFTEADAYVAQAVSAMSSGKQYFLEYPALETAGRLALAGKGVAGNAEWSNAYDAVVRAVEADPLYADTKNRPFKPGDAEKGRDEAKELSSLLGGHQAGRGARRVGGRRGQVRLPKRDRRRHQHVAVTAGAARRAGILDGFIRLMRSGRRAKNLAQRSPWLHLGVLHKFQRWKSR